MIVLSLKLALRSQRGHPTTIALVVFTLALGIGAFMSSAIVLRNMQANPAGIRGAQLFNVQLDNQPEDSPYASAGEPPDLLTYMDVKALLDAAAAERQVAMYGATVVAGRDQLSERSTPARMTSADFFAMFDTPFRYGQGWSDSQADERVAVLASDLNQRLFDGRNSVGEAITINGDSFLIVGVLDHWRPLPRYYDLSVRAFNQPEDIYLPLRYGIATQVHQSGSRNCWPPYDGTYKQLLASECIWFNFWVFLPDENALRSYREFLDTYMRAQMMLGRFADGPNYRLRDVRNWIDSQNVIPSASKTQFALATAFCIVSLVNAAAILIAYFSSSLYSASVCRALGATRRQLFVQYLIDAGLIGLFSGAAGLLLTQLALVSMRGLDDQLLYLARMSWTSVSATILFALASTSIIAVIPAHLACRRDWSACLRSA